MKAIVTILQNRRVALPHLFTTYALPEMRRLFGGELECVLVQHAADASGGQTKLESLKLASEGMDRVRDWTEAEKFPCAEVIRHERVHRPYPHIPSFHLAVERALDAGADYHLWMEDDAFVLDRSCGFWDRLIGEAEVGVYAPTPQHLHPAFMVTTRAFDERIHKSLSKYDEWDWKKRRVEPWLRRQLTKERAYLPRHSAVRHHVRSYPYTGIRYVVDALRGICPNALDVLDIDFGPGCADLAPVTRAELRADERRERRGIINRYWLLRHGLWTQLGVPMPSSH